MNFMPHAFGENDERIRPFGFGFGRPFGFGFGFGRPFFGFGFPFLGGLALGAALGGGFGYPYYPYYPYYPPYPPYPYPYGYWY